MTIELETLRECLEIFESGQDRSLLAANKAEDALLEFLAHEETLVDALTFDELGHALAMFRPGGDEGAWDVESVMPFVRAALRSLEKMAKHLGE